MTDDTHFHIPAQEWGKLKSDIEYIKTKIDLLDARVEKQNGRVDKLESWRDRINGQIILIAFIVSVAISVGIKVLF